MTKYERAVFGVLELCDADVISFGRAAEVLGLKIMQLREYNLRRPAESVIWADNQKKLERLSKRFGKRS